MFQPLLMKLRLVGLLLRARGATFHHSLRSNYRDNVRKLLGRATALPMDEVGMAVAWLAIIAAGAIAGIVTDSPWGGIIVAALGIGLCGLLIVRHQPR